MSGFYFALLLFGFVGCCSLAAECHKDFTNCPKVGSSGKTRDEKNARLASRSGVASSRKWNLLCADSFVLVFWD